MSFRAGLYQLLSTAPSLVALQGARVFPVILPEDTLLPATTYHVVGGSQRATFTTSGPQRRRVQLDFRASSCEVAEQLQDATIALLNGFFGPLPNGFVLTNCEYLQSIDDFDSDARQFRLATEFYFYFNLP